MADAFIGEIRAFPYTFNPAGWLLCDGSDYEIAEYTALYSIIGTLYGTTTSPTLTFRVPDLVGRTAIGTGTISKSKITCGDMLGRESTALTIANLPPHTHQLNTMLAKGSDYYSSEPTAGKSWLGRYYLKDGDNLTIYRPYNPTKPASGEAVPTNAVEMGSLDTSGESYTIDLMQPYCVMGYYICSDGDYPQRP